VTEQELIVALGPGVTTCGQAHPQSRRECDLPIGHSVLWTTEAGKMHRTSYLMPHGGRVTERWHGEDL
jgi:hypothetical protein